MTSVLSPPERTTVDHKVERLNTASLRRVVEPDEEVTGDFGPGQVIPDHLLSVADLDVDLTPEQRVRLSREEVASILQEGIRFEAVLMAGFGLQIAEAADLTDPRVTYMLHEMGEETRHSRLFARLVGQLRPTARNPLARPVPVALFNRGIRAAITRPAMLFTLVLAGEEIPDLFQKLACEDERTDPYLAAVNRYHRAEEARHLAYARLVLPEVWQEAGAVDRFLVRRVAPHVIAGMFAGIVHPGVYRTVGLPVWSTWRRANRSPARRALRYRATRPILAQVMAAGALPGGRVPKGWRGLCGVDARGEPVPGTAA